LEEEDEDEALDLEDIEEGEDEDSEGLGFEDSIESEDEHSEEGDVSDDGDIQTMERIKDDLFADEETTEGRRMHHLMIMGTQ
jgi:U3 small nucleolar RNA-associated protein MPP10